MVLRMEDFIQLFSNGLVYTDRSYIRQTKDNKQVFYHESLQPRSCLFCGHPNPHFHRHGYYLRHLKTLRDSILVTILLYNLRWLCVHCRHTMSVLPDDIFPYKRCCALYLLFTIWLYLHCMTGYYDKNTHTHSAPDGRTIHRYIQAAKKVAVYTHQFIREVLIDIGEPRPLELVFKSGLSPPENLMKRYQDLRRGKSVKILWQTTAMLLTTCKKHNITPSKLLAQAHKNAKERHQSFLM